MSISPKCSWCDAELIVGGGLVFSPPKLETNDVKKYHICIACFPYLYVIRPEFAAPKKVS